MLKMNFVWFRGWSAYDSEAYVHELPKNTKYALGTQCSLFITHYSRLVAITHSEA